MLQRVHLDIQVGEHANNYAEIAAKDKLTELQLRVRQLVEQVDQIQKEQNYQRVSHCTYQILSHCRQMWWVQEVFSWRSRWYNRVGVNREQEQHKKSVIKKEQNRDGCLCLTGSILWSGNTHHLSALSSLPSQYREERFRQTSESTNQRVLWWSIVQTLILVAIGIWQMRHLKSFFEAKKLV